MAFLLFLLGMESRDIPTAWDHGEVVWFYRTIIGSLLPSSCLSLAKEPGNIPNVIAMEPSRWRRSTNIPPEVEGKRCSLDGSTYDIYLFLHHPNLGYGTLCIQGQVMRIMDVSHITSARPSPKRSAESLPYQLLNTGWLPTPPNAKTLCSLENVSLLNEVAICGLRREENTNIASF